MRDARIGDAYLDSRDIDELIADIEDQVGAIREELEANGLSAEAIEDELESSSEYEDWKRWTDFRDDVSPYAGSEWKHGLQLIHEDSFVEHAQTLADDIGAVDRNATWPTKRKK